MRVERAGAGPDLRPRQQMMPLTGIEGLSRGQNSDDALGQYTTSQSA